jgi:hypothetical protein
VSSSTEKMRATIGGWHLRVVSHRDWRARHDAYENYDSPSLGSVCARAEPECPTNRRAVRVRPPPFRGVTATAAIRGVSLSFTLAPARLPCTAAWARDAKDCGGVGRGTCQR